VQHPDPTGLTVLILRGEFSGQEGVCLGPVAETSGVWAVSPKSSDRILNLGFPDEFGIVVNSGQETGRN
jgi:hypothetical protein